MRLHLGGDAVELDAGKLAEEHLWVRFVRHDQRLVLAVIGLVPVQEDRKVGSRRAGGGWQTGVVVGGREAGGTWGGAEGVGSWSCGDSMCLRLFDLGCCLMRNVRERGHR